MEVRGKLGQLLGQRALGAPQPSHSPAWPGHWAGLSVHSAYPGPGFMSWHAKWSEFTEWLQCTQGTRWPPLLPGGPTCLCSLPPVCPHHTISKQGGPQKGLSSLRKQNKKKRNINTEWAESRSPDLEPFKIQLCLQQVELARKRAPGLPACR